MIIIEGMDNTGKTTLLQELHQALEIPWVKSPGPEHLSGLSKDEWFRWVEASISPDQCCYLFDRHPLISEPIYGKILRGFDVFEGTYFKEGFKLANPLIIYCRPPRERIFHFGNRKQMESVIEFKEVLLATYDEFINQLRQDNFDIVIYNYTTMDVKTIITLAHRYLQGISTLKVVK